MNMGEFRELTGDIPDEWPVMLAVRNGGDFTFVGADASVNLTSRCVEISDD